MTDKAKTTVPPLGPEDWTTQYDDTHTFPFVEDEDGNITGYGHQDLDAFAAAINEYDAVCGDVHPEAELWTGDEIAHHWVTVDEDGERLHPCSADTPGAVPVTGLWGQR